MDKQEGGKGEKKNEVKGRKEGEQWAEHIVGAQLTHQVNPSAKEAAQGWVKSQGPGTTLLGHSLVQPLLTVGSWAGDITSQCLSSPICKMEH